MISATNHVNGVSLLKFEDMTIYICKFYVKIKFVKSNLCNLFITFWKEVKGYSINHSSCGKFWMILRKAHSYYYQRFENALCTFNKRQSSYRPREILKRVEVILLLCISIDFIKRYTIQITSHLFNMFAETIFVVTDLERKCFKNQDCF